MTDEQLEKLGTLVDKTDNFLTLSYMPPDIALPALKQGLTEIRDELQFLYVELTGDDPWDGIYE